MNKLKQALIAVIFFGYAFCIRAQTGTAHLELSQISIVDSAQIWYNNIKKNCISPNMNPWPVDLYGKIMFVEPNSGFLVANHQNTHNSFT